MPRRAHRRCFVRHEIPEETLFVKYQDIFPPLVFEVPGQMHSEDLIEPLPADSDEDYQRKWLVQTLIDGVKFALVVVGIVFFGFAIVNAIPNLAEYIKVCIFAAAGYMTIFTIVLITSYFVDALGERFKSYTAEPQNVPVTLTNEVLNRLSQFELVMDNPNQFIAAEEDRTLVEFLPDTELSSEVGVDSTPVRCHRPAEILSELCRLCDPSFLNIPQDCIDSDPNWCNYDTVPSYCPATMGESERYWSSNNDIRFGYTLTQLPNVNPTSCKQNSSNQEILKIPSPTCVSQPQVVRAPTNDACVVSRKIDTGKCESKPSNPETISKRPIAQAKLRNRKNQIASKVSQPRSYSQSSTKQRYLAATTEATISQPHQKTQNQKH